MFAQAFVLLILIQTRFDPYRNVDHLSKPLMKLTLSRKMNMQRREGTVGGGCC